MTSRNILLLFLALVLGGCATPLPPKNEKELKFFQEHIQRSEKEIEAYQKFHQACQTFYSQLLRWPTSISEFELFLKNQKIKLPVSFKEASIQINNAYEMNLVYQQNSKEIISQNAYNVQAPDAPSCPKEELCLLAGRFRLKDPKPFVRLTPSEVAQRFPHPPQPQVVFAHPDNANMIALFFSPTPMLSENLEKERDALVKIYEQSIPQLIWRDKKMLKGSGIPWIYLEFDSLSMKGALVNASYLSSFDGKLFNLNFHIEKNAWTDFKPLIKEIFKSVELNSTSDKSKDFY